MSKTTYAAVSPAGDVFTRASATRPYTHAVIVQNRDGGAWGAYSYHLSEAGAVKQANAGGGFLRSRYARVLVVDVTPIELTGKALKMTLAAMSEGVKAIAATER